MFKKHGLDSVSDDSDKHVVMLVDDEQENIDVLRVVLEKDYKIIEAISGLQAIEIIDNMEDPEKVALIISDQRMPNMTGVEFFEKIIKKVPDAIRIILTGYTDSRAIVDSINKANIYKFIPKPFDPPDLILTVARAVELYKLRLDLKASNRLKREFIATISHELLTPMNGIQGGLELIDFDEPVDNLKVNISAVEKSAQQMRGLIDSIISFTIFESGETKLNSRIVDFNDLLQPLLDEYAAKCEKRGLSFETKMLEPGTLLYADVEKIKHITHYLLANAVKFTESGEVALAYATRKDRSGEHLVITIEDTGIGIDKPLHNEIFEIFKQADGSFSRQYGGLGIGLALTKRLVDLFKGRIHLDSTLGEGTKIVVTLPVTIQSDKSAGLIDEVCNTQIERAPLILVVEDNAINQQILKSMLIKSGCQVEVCSDGVEAVEWCDKYECDLVFMDCQMPVMDGLEATSRIRASSILNNEKPIVAITANVSDYDKEKCANVGMNLFLCKPYNKKVIMGALDKFLDAQFGKQYIDQ